MTRSLVWILFLTPLLACTGDLPLPEEVRTEAKPLRILWKKSLTDLQPTLSMDPIIFDDVVVINSEHVFHGVNGPVMFIDTADGSLIGTWSDFSVGPVQYPGASSNNEGQFALFGSQSSIDCLNLSTRSTQWQSVLKDSGPWIYLSNGYVYRGIHDVYRNGSWRRGTLIRSSLQTGVWDTIYSIRHDNDGYSPFFISINTVHLPNGDEVVVWKNRTQHSWKPDITEVLAFNLDADTLMWRNRELKDLSSVEQLQIENGIIYLLLSTQMAALDLNTGQVLWTQDFSTVNMTLPMNFMQADFHLTSNKIIIKAASDELIYLHKASGNVARVIDGYPFGMNHRMTAFEDMLFLSTSRLVILDARTGDELITSKQVEHLGNPLSQIVIDPIRRVLYYHDMYYLYCIKIPNDL